MWRIPNSLCPLRENTAHPDKRLPAGSEGRLVPQKSADRSSIGGFTTVTVYEYIHDYSSLKKHELCKIMLLLV